MVQEELKPETVNPADNSSAGQDVEKTSKKSGNTEMIVFALVIISALICTYFTGFSIFKIQNSVYLSLAIGFIALTFAGVLSSKILRAAPGNDRMIEISTYIQQGAMAFLSREYKVLSLFVIAVFATIAYFIKLETAICFISGAICSAIAGFIGMTISTRANTRTANAAITSLNSALGIAFSGGAVMGMVVVGLGLVGLSILYLIYNDPNIVNGFALGGSSIALFARVGGGIYTKAADVGADLVGKVEAGIPEDDPRNPAVIADNVGDNVGDVAGMGADLFESYVGSIIAAMVLGSVIFGFNGVVLPMMISAAGIVASILGTLFVRTDEKSNPMKALNIGTISAAVLLVVFSYFITQYLLPEKALDIFWALLVGLVAGTGIGLITEYYTSADHKPVKDIAQSSLTGSATNIIAGLGVGMLSTFLPIVLISIAIIISYMTGGIYGIAMAAVGMLATTGMVVAVDAYGPISDNAGGIAEMAKLPKEVRERTDKLDSVGNTTAAIGKGFAIGSAALTALALLTAFTAVVGIKSIDLLKPEVTVGILFGATLPFVFCALTMSAVGRAASKMVDEVRRQFREIVGIMEGTSKPDYARCVDISTTAAIKEMVIPGMLAVIAPVSFGLILGPEALGGMLTGAIASGVCLAIMLANAGGAWDNAKKYIESGMHGGKGSPAHAAAVTGDTVGDPCKDTSGPSLNILLKLMTIVSLVFAPLFM
jgi:K(+)-stimulated pyrophosphate-energized sodium pump